MSSHSGSSGSNSHKLSFLKGLRNSKDSFSLKNDIDPRRLSKISLTDPSSSSSKVTLGDSNNIQDISQEVDMLKSSYRKQSFWKYHILKISEDEFYMTTNPDHRHKFIRNAPSYFVKLELPNNSNKKGPIIDRGFRLSFTKQQIAGVNAEDDIYKPFIIEKMSKNEGGGYRICCQYNEFQEKMMIQNDINVSNFNKKKEIRLNFESIKDIEYCSLENSKLLLTENYTFNNNLNVCCINDQKKNVFTFNNSLEGVKLAKKGSVYFLDTAFFKKEKWFDPVIAIFRPNNRSVKSKITKKVLSKLNQSNSTMFNSKRLNIDFSNISGTNNSDDSDSNNTDGDSEEDENILDLELNSSQTTFYEAKDGFINRHPKDDSPNDFKVGWLVIYEKGRYFEKIPNGGNWQLVMGMTFAVGFEKLIDKQLSESD